MKDHKLSAILGRDVQVGETLSTEDLQKVFAALPEPTLTDKTEDPNGNGTTQTEEKPEGALSQEQMVEAITAKLSANLETMVQAAMSPIDSKVSGIESRIAKIENGKGATATVTAPVDGNHEEVEESYSTKMAKQMLNQQ